MYKIIARENKLSQYNTFTFPIQTINAQKSMKLRKMDSVSLRAH